MRTIYKWQIPVAARVRLEVPRGAQFLSAAEAQGLTHISLWALVDTDQPMVARRLSVRGTGDPIEEADGRHIATVHIVGFAWHVFDLGLD